MRRLRELLRLKYDLDDAALEARVFARPAVPPARDRVVPDWIHLHQEPSVADAICDRVIHQAHRLTLKGPTMRDPGTRRGTKAPA